MSIFAKINKLMMSIFAKNNTNSRKWIITKCQFSRKITYVLKKWIITKMSIFAKINTLVENGPLPKCQFSRKSTHSRKWIVTICQFSRKSTLSCSFLDSDSASTLSIFAKINTKTDTFIP